MSTPEPQEDEAGDILQDRRRQTLRDGHAQPSRDEIEDKMQIYDEQHPVRQRPCGGENKQTPGENMDVEGGALGWARSGTDNRQPSTEDEMQKTAATTSPKRPKKLKIDRQEATPLCVGGVDRELWLPLLTKNVTPHLETPRDATHLQNREPEH
jgi:hypothetical protein